MQGNTAQKTGLLSLFLTLTVLAPNIALSPVYARTSHQAADPASSSLVSSAFPISALNHPDIHPIHKQIAYETLSAMSTPCVSQLESLYVRYEKPTSRGLAGKTSIILDGTVSASEFRALLIHEFGHIVDLGCFAGAQSAGESAFRDGSEIIFKDDPSIEFYALSWLNDQHRRDDVDPDDFVSGYAASDPFEDFAETFAYFILQRNAFRIRAATNPTIAKKYNWMRDHFDTVLSATGQHRWDGSVPWDITKLPYIWHRKTVAIKT
ncbi:putative zinc-binding metallopeptidase [Candidatus Peregrinibacteria bacterium]|nr:putative zinc-binding metallopeptidase [Candidatus Peregrinibacteria bacterium]